MTLLFMILLTEVLIHISILLGIRNIKFSVLKLPGFMKDELKGKIMTEFISLRSKVYTYKVDGCDVRCKIKGVSKAGTKDICFEDFFKCLFKNKNC